MMRHDQPPEQKTVIPPRGGLLHFVDATGYSIAGMVRLWRETAARQEILGGLAGAALLLVAGASLQQGLFALVLWLVLLAVEALNTAIEELVDHISPEWSQAAKHAKDLGSLAVGLLVLANLVWLGVVCFGLV